jgi:hypothetical protein
MSTPLPFAIPKSRIWSGDRGMTILLVLLVLVVFVVPVVVHFGSTGAVLVDVAVTLTLLSGIAATSGRRARILFSAVALFALAVRWMPWLVPDLSAPLLRETASLATFVLLAGIVAGRVFQRGTVTMDRVMGAVVLYLLLGICWALCFNLVALGDTRAFVGLGKDYAGLHDWVYFSFVTLTTVGYGDVTPVSPLARSLAILEALVGQLYPAILLGRLVSLQVQEGGSR